MKKERKRGSMTVEAALFLVIFMMAFLTILNFARVARAEVIMQHAINNSAMQISQYGYLLTKTGVADELIGTANVSEKMNSDISQVTGAISNFSDAIGNSLTNGFHAEDIDTLANAASGLQEAAGIANEYYKNPKGLLTGLAAIGKNRLEENAATFIVSKMAKAQTEYYLEEYLNVSGKTPDEYLQGLGIVGGMEGLDFKDSKCIAGGNKDIRIVVKFKVKNIMFPWMDFGEHEMCLSASTRIW